MIGVFDSGFGGLTVLRALHDALPDRRFVFLGDHCSGPYGNRAPDEILALTRRATGTLFDLGCRLVVLACNTAASTSLRRLQQDWLPNAYPDHRILGVVVPMVEAVTGMPWMADLPARPAEGRPQTVAILATRQTVLSNAYPVEIGKRAPWVKVVQQACPRLVDLIEGGAGRDAMAAMVRRYVDDLMEKLEGRAPDVVMLGCTHYPLIQDLFAAALPAGAAILSQPDLSARSLAAYLDRHPDLDQPDSAAPQRFYTTGDPDAVSRLGSVFFGRTVRFESISTARRIDGADPQVASLSMA